LKFLERDKKAQHGLGHSFSHQIIEVKYPEWPLLTHVHVNNILHKMHKLALRSLFSAGDA